MSMPIKKVSNALLFLTQTLSDLKRNVVPLLEESIKYTSNNLYIYISPSAKLPNNIAQLEDRYELKNLLANFYQSSFRLNPDLNVTCLLHNFHHNFKQFSPSSNIKQKDYDLILTDLAVNDNSFIEQYLNSTLPNFKKSIDHIPLYKIECPCIETNIAPISTTVNPKNPTNDLLFNNKIYLNSILGGTFDRLHIGHKLMLSESALLTQNRMLIGIACENLLVKKVLSELLQDIDIRCKSVESFLSTIAPNLELVIEPIKDPFGPSITEKDYQCLIVSEETQKNGHIINQKRIENNLPPLDIHIINLVGDDFFENDGDEAKVSSSNLRRRILGTMLKPPIKCYDSSRPYVIGLTGGLASGKTSIRKDLESLGVATIDCDKLGHKTYEKNTSAYKKIIETFGEEILDESKNIHRPTLGKKVFQLPHELKKLTDIVWPEIKNLLEIEIENLFKNGHKLIVVEAAVLLEANWQEGMNETWVVFVPYEEAVKRAMQRDNQSMERVKNILDSQISNKERISKANVVISSLWERDFTIKQVKRAWNLLIDRTLKTNSKL